jgi:hypothetical protein
LPANAASNFAPTSWPRTTPCLLRLPATLFDPLIKPGGGFALNALVLLFEPSHAVSQGCSQQKHFHGRTDFYRVGEPQRIGQQAHLSQRDGRDALITKAAQADARYLASGNRHSTQTTAATTEAAKKRIIPMKTEVSWARGLHLRLGLQPAPKHHQRF